MIKCRSIPPEQWADAYQKLVFYFSRRHRRADAEDLAQQTLTSVWKRNLDLKHAEDFLKLCHGFAKNIHKAGVRHTIRDSHPPLEFDVPAPEPEAQRLSGPQVGILIGEILDIGEKLLSEKDRQLLREMVEAELSGGDEEPRSGQERLRKHRLRTRLAKIVGWIMGRKRNGK